MVFAGAVNATFELNARNAVKQLNEINGRLKEFNRLAKSLNRSGFNRLGKDLDKATKSVKQAQKGINSLNNTINNTSKGINKTGENIQQTDKQFSKFFNNMDKEAARGEKRLKYFFESIDKHAKNTNKYFDTTVQEFGKLNKELNDNYRTISSQNNRLRTENYQLAKSVGVVNRAKEKGLINEQKQKKLIRETANYYGGIVKNNLVVDKERLALLQRYTTEFGRLVKSWQKAVGKGMGFEAAVKNAPITFMREFVSLLNETSPSAKNATTFMGKLKGAFKDGVISASQFSNAITPVNAGLLEVQKSINNLNMNKLNNLDKRFMVVTRSQRMMNYAMQVAALKNNVFSNVKDITAGIVLGGFVNNLVYARYQSVKLDQQMRKFFKTMKQGGTNINDFEKSLDAYVKQFPKVSKYTVGATIAQVGKLNSLTQKQMKDMIPLTSDLINMMQLNGRTAEDAYLAIADAFDGQFKRLQEIGVQGKKDLEKYGYTGTADSLIKALTKIGKEKGWSDLTKNIETTEDALQVLGNCIDMIVVPAFNALAKPMVATAKFVSNLVVGFNKLNPTMKVVAGVSLILGYSFLKMRWAMLQARILGSKFMATLTGVNNNMDMLDVTVAKNVSNTAAATNQTNALTSAQSNNIKTTDAVNSAHANTVKVIEQESLMVQNLTAMYERLSFAQRQSAINALAGSGALTNVAVMPAAAANLSWMQAGAFKLAESGVDTGKSAAILQKVLNDELLYQERTSKVLLEYAELQNRSRMAEMLTLQGYSLNNKKITDKIIKKSQIKTSKYASPILGTHITNLDEIEIFNKVNKNQIPKYGSLPIIKRKDLSVYDIYNNRIKEFNKLQGISRTEIMKNNAVIGVNRLSKLKDIEVTGKQIRNTVMAAKATEGLGLKYLATRAKMALYGGSQSILTKATDKLKNAGSALLEVITAHPYAFAAAAAAAAAAAIWYVTFGQSIARSAYASSQYYDLLQNGEQKIASMKKAAAYWANREKELIKERDKYKKNTTEWINLNNAVAQAHENAATMAQKAVEIEGKLAEIRGVYAQNQVTYETSTVTADTKVKKIYEKAGAYKGGGVETKIIEGDAAGAGATIDTYATGMANVKDAKYVQFAQALVNRKNKGEALGRWAIDTPAGEAYRSKVKLNFLNQKAMAKKREGDPSLFGRFEGWLGVEYFKLQRGYYDLDARYQSTLWGLKTGWDQSQKQLAQRSKEASMDQLKNAKKTQPKSSLKNLYKSTFGSIKLPKISPVKTDKIFKTPKGSSKDGWNVLTRIFGGKPTRTDIEIKNKTKASDWGILSRLFGDKKTITASKDKAPKASAAMVDKKQKTKKDVESEDIKELTPEEKERRRKKFLAETRMKESEPRGFVQQITTSLSGLPVVGGFFTQISSAMGGLMDRFPPLRNAFNTINTAAKPFTDALSRIYGSVNRLKSPFDTLNSSINSLRGSFTSLQAKWNEITGKTGWAKRVKTSIWDNALSPLYSKIKEFVNFVKNPFGTTGALGESPTAQRLGSSRLGASGFSGGNGNRGMYSLSKTAAGGLVDNWGSGIFNSLRSNGLVAGSPVSGGRKIINPKECKDERTCYAGIVENWSNYTINKMKNLPMNIYGYVVKVKDFFTDKLKIFEAVASHLISRTSYDYYYGDRFSNAEALARGAFNCYDGAQILIELANKLGLSASMGHGYWGNDRHVWAIVGGKVFDTTAFQHGYGWTSPKVKAAGTSSNIHKESNINITISGNIYGVNDIENVMEKTAKEVFNRMWE